MALVLNILCLILALPALVGSVYLLILTLMSSRLPQRSPALPNPGLRFHVLIPAHDEKAVIEATLDSVLSLDWPRDQYRVVVIADNCTDETAALARQRGATVLERTDDRLRGKGHALAFGLAHLQARESVDAWVVIDADTQVHPNLLKAFADHLAQGALALQGRYGVLNPNASWRTRLGTIAFAAFHDVRSRARERLGVSCGLRGNGMCFSDTLLRTHPMQAYSLAEDIEYGIALGKAGIRVHYVEDAQVWGELPTGSQAAGSQRQRWEQGRLLLLSEHVLPLLRQSVTARSRICLDLALDLLVLPLSFLILDIALVAVLAGLLTPWWAQAGYWLGLSVMLLLCLVAHVLRGWQLSGLGARALLDFLRVPYFILWKLVTLVKHRKNRQWVRTERNK